MIEFAFHHYSFKKTETNRFVEIAQGTIDLETMILKSLNTEEGIKVIRAKENQKIRPSATKRHDPFQEIDETQNKRNFIHDTNLEWLSLNFRKYRAS